MIDAVLSYHLNPQTCGVTKFNMQLAERLGVRHEHMPGARWMPTERVLLSIKTSEMGREWYRWLPSYGRFDLLLHDHPVDLLSMYHKPEHILYADELGCPSTLRGNPYRPGLAVLSYGMAHKFNEPHFEKLKHLLDLWGEPYHIAVSSAIHEGSPWDATTAEHTDRLRRIFGDRLRWLGFLADDGLAREIRHAHTIALFYEPAVRANNTTLWAAMDAGVPVITNLDAHSPPELQHGVSVLDINRMTEWVDYNGERQILRAGGTKAAAVYSWDRLIEKLTAIHA